MGRWPPQRRQPPSPLPVSPSLPPPHIAINSPPTLNFVQRWAEAALDAQLKGMKTSLRLTADQEKDWGPFESAVKDSAKARVVALQKEQKAYLVGQTASLRLNCSMSRSAGMAGFRASLDGGGGSP